ncbi:hypothetical protein Q8A73_002929 [Channa argus]|nr:hypothetical protein Q8A73_002929 [Channa argus]
MLWMWKCGSSARRAMRDTLLAATMAPSLPCSGSLRVLLMRPAVRTRSPAKKEVSHRVVDAHWMDGQRARRGEGRHTGATLALRRYGKRSSKDTERRDRGRIQTDRQPHCLSSPALASPPRCFSATLPGFTAL